MMSPLIGCQSRVPPGFRFHPTEEELLQYYLKKKVAHEKIDLDVILEIDLNKVEPWDIEETCRIGSTPQNEWYLFSHKDKKYPTGIRANRATAAGFWKATGRDKVIRSSSKRIGMRKTLVFYLGRAPNGQKSDWIMHEYRLEESTDTNSQSNPSSSAGVTQEEEGWVVCRVFRKKNLLKTLDSTPVSSLANDVGTQMLSSSREGALDHILKCVRESCNMEGNNSNTSYMTYLPALSDNVQAIPSFLGDSSCPNHPALSDWTAVDRMVASHLNDQSDSFKQLDFINNSNLSLLPIQDQQDLQTHNCNDNVHLWSFTL